MASKYKKSNRLSAIVTIIFLTVAVVLSFALSGKGFSNLSFKDTISDFDTNEDFVRFLDVGQGDSILIYSNGYSALIDAGTQESGNRICAALSDCNIKQIDVLIISHLHSDHTGGIGRITEINSIKNLILPEISVESEGLGDAQLAINRVTKSGGNVYTAVAGMNFTIGEFEVTILASYGDMKDENNRSVIVMAKKQDYKFLFTGDAETKTEKKLLEDGLNLKCDVLKAGHHGSSTSSCEAFLKAARPRYVAISVGKDNMYGHPHKEVLADLEYIGAEIYRTDLGGDITFFVKESGIVKK